MKGKFPPMPRRHEAEAGAMGLLSLAIVIPFEAKRSARLSIFLSTP